VTMLHGWTDMSGRMPLYKRVDQWCLPWYQQSICVSEDLVEECRNLKIPEHKIQLVHNAIDLGAYTRWLSKTQAKADMGGGQDSDRLVGMVCRLSPEKGILEAIAMVARFRMREIPIQLWIAGDGPYRSEIEKEIARLGLESSVRLLGQLADARPFYQAMDVFLLNSIREGLPNVVLEAMALEVPVVATRIAGVPTLVRPGQTGWLIEPGDESGLDSAIEQSTEDSELAENYRQRASRMIAEEFSFSKRIERVASIYDGLTWSN